MLFPVLLSSHFKVLVSPIILSCSPMFFFVVLKAFQTAHPGCPAFCIYQFFLRTFPIISYLWKKNATFFFQKHLIILLLFGDKMDEITLKFGLPIC